MNCFVDELLVKPAVFYKNFQYWSLSFEPVGLMDFQRRYMWVNSSWSDGENWVIIVVDNGLMTIEYQA